VTNLAKLPLPYRTIRERASLAIYIYIFVLKRVTLVQKENLTLDLNSKLSKGVDHPTHVV